MCDGGEDKDHPVVVRVFSKCFAPIHAHRIFLLLAFAVPIFRALFCFVAAWAGIFSRKGVSLDPRSGSQTVWIRLAYISSTLGRWRGGGPTVASSHPGTTPKMLGARQSRARQKPKRQAPLSRKGPGRKTQRSAARLGAVVHQWEAFLLLLYLNAFAFLQRATPLWLQATARAL